MATRTPTKGKGSKKAAEAKKPAKNPSTRKEKLLEGVLQGKTPANAARDAGYSESYARVDVYRTLANPSIQERIEARIRDAQLHTDEIIGTLVSHMRGDFGDMLPGDAFIQELRALGVSHLVRELEITERRLAREVRVDGEVEPQDVLERKYKIKIHDSQSAAKQLCSVFQLEKKPNPGGPNGGQQQPADLTPVQRKEQAADLLEQGRRSLEQVVT